MHSGAVVEVEVDDSKLLVDYRPFYEGVLKGIRNLLFLDKTNPVYLVTQLWSAGPESIEPYSVAIKERVAVNGGVYKGAAKRTSSEAKRIRDANKLMCDLCIVDEQSRDLFIELFEYALCKFVSDCEKQNLPLGSSSVAAVVEGFKEFFSKRPIYMSINVVKGADAVRVGAPKEGYLEGDPGGSCMRFHSVFFRFKREIPQKKEISTTMLLLFLSSLMDFFSVLVVSKESLFKRGGAKVSYEGLRITECSVSPSDAYEAECKKEKMLYIAGEFLAGSRAGRWSFGLDCVEFLTEEELAYLPKRAASSSMAEWRKYHAQLCPDKLCYQGEELSVEEVRLRVCGTHLHNSSSEEAVCPGVSGQSEALSGVVFHRRNSAVLPLENDSSNSSRGGYVVFEPVPTTSASTFEGVPSMLEESAAVESAAAISASMKHA
ncbi:conserved hypothetical protein [Neorickettsia risticii str. Illinois]|uniref:Uncharacterized protein n=1 Tax=Neorickettsia risticii (strain Illinois) TaxID=434131 RepID=C6V582_NEORI|nr:hypothetical protein [Neorickettsia risticii]ACT69558.1 conserved hypothetical protein [Neorickettsia risticii str. Illinois]